MAGSMARPAFGGQGKRLSFHGYFPFERTFFPFLQIAYHAEPCGMLRLLEVEGIVVGLDRFETEYFDKRSRFFMEVQTRLKRLDYELSKAPEYDYILVNDKLESAVDRLEKIYLSLLEKKNEN